jgi:amidase
MTLEEYRHHDALGLAARIRAGHVTATELLEIALDAVRALNPRVNAVVHLMERDAREAAAQTKDGPFAGVPFLAKDLHSDYAGHPTTAGSRLLEGTRADHDTELARRTRAAGLVVFGKTNLPEWGLVPFTEPALFGPCHNPWDLRRTPGGSSGGSAAAVASGMVPMAGGGDGGGSIRIPASCCGLFGLKPTRARTPTGPDLGLLWRGATVEHVLTRSVRDSAAMLDATQGPDAGAPFQIEPPSGPYLQEVEREPGRLRIACTARPFVETEVHPDCVRAMEDAAAMLEALGHEVVEATPRVDGPAFAHAFLTMLAAEVGADLRRVEGLTGRVPGRKNLEAATWSLALLSRACSAEEYALALRALESAGRAVGSFFESWDVLLTPTLACPPPPIGALSPSRKDRWLLSVLGAMGSGRVIRAAGVLDEAARTAFAFTPFTPAFNVTGQPAMSVPLYWTDQELPVGVQLVGRFGREDVLFRLAGQLERARPWFSRLPALARERVDGEGRGATTG